MRKTKPSRTIDFLNAVVQAQKPIATTEIASALGLTLPTAHRMAVEFVEEGYLRRAFGSKKLAVGPKLARFGIDVASAWLREAPRHAILQSLTEEIGEQCELGILQNNRVIYIDGGRTASPASLHFEPGLHAPMHCTSIGKLFLASLTNTTLRDLLATLKLPRFTPKTIVDARRLTRQILEVQRNGFATTNEEYVIGVVGCGVPICGPAQNTVAGLALSVPAARIAFDDLPKFIPALRKAAARLEKTLDT